MLSNSKNTLDTLLGVWHDTEYFIFIISHDHHKKSGEITIILIRVADEKNGI